MRSTGSIASLTLTAALVAACGAAAATSPAPTPSPAPTLAAPSPTPTTPPAPTPTTLPQTDGEGDEVVFGVDDISLTTPYTDTKMGDVRQIRGGIVAIKATMNDPRVTGTATFRFSVDLYTRVGPEWGTFHLENADGAWDGTCSGAAWDEGNHPRGATAVRDTRAAVLCLRRGL